MTSRRLSASLAAATAVIGVAGTLAIALAHSPASATAATSNPTGRPLAVATTATNDIQGYWRGANCQLDQDLDNGGSWSGAATTPISGLNSSPAAVAVGGVDYVFWQGTDGNLWEATEHNGSWSAATRLNMGVIGSEPAVDSWSPFSGVTEIDVFWVGSASKHDLWQASWLTSTKTWSSGTSDGMGPLESAPAASVNGTGSSATVHVFWRNSSNQVVQADGTGGTSWSGPTVRDSSVSTAPTTNSLRGGKTELFWRGSGNSLFQDSYNGTKWKGGANDNLGGLASAPTALRVVGGTSYDVFWTGADGDLWMASNNGSTWTSAQSVGSMTPPPPPPPSQSTATATAPAPTTPPPAATALAVSPAVKVTSRKCRTERVRRGGRSVKRRVCRTTTVPGKAGSARIGPGRPRSAHGRLMSGTTPVAGATITVTKQIRGFRTRTLKPVTTNAAGEFSYRLSGPSSSYRFTYPGSATLAGAEALQPVNAATTTTLRVPARLRAGHRATLSGTVRGGYVPAGGLLVQLYYRVRGHGRAWSPFGPQIHSGKRGGWRVRIPISAGARGYTYQFEARVGAQSGWPFRGATSAAVTRTIR